MTKFLAGLLAGAACYAGVDGFITDRESSDPTQTVASHPSIEASPAAVGRVDRTIHRDDAVQLTAAGKSAPCISLDGADCDEALERLLEARSKHERSILEAEPKDPLWSASMEQQLREFITRHPAAGRYLITRLDCRTLYCEIDAQTQTYPGDANVDAFAKILDEVEQQLGLRRGASGGSSDGTLRQITARLRRFRPGMPCPPGYTELECWNR